MCGWEFVLLLLSCFGLTLILVHGKIFDRPREYLSGKCDFFRKLIKCSMCTGWWVGMLMGGLILLHTISPLIFYLICMPFASSGVCFILERLVIFIDDHIEE